MKREKKDEENIAASNPYVNCDKTTVLQESRQFNETAINARQCTSILSKFLYILGQGEKLTRKEATDAFFLITKLWQSNDTILRRLVYLAVKELAPQADDVIIVTSSLTKDMTGKENIYRAAAIRALCRITDASMLQAIERYMKQAIVDRVPAVASAALVSSLHLLKKNPDCIRRWANEIREAINSENPMIQYHGLVLFYEIRKHDRLAVMKLAQKYCKQGLRSSLATCYLTVIMLPLRLLVFFPISRDTGMLLDFIDSCLRNKSEIVVYEAASALIRLPNITSKELASAVSVLQLFCSSSKAVLRFASVRTLSTVANNYPAAVAACNVDLEQLISDPNRSVATLAITTLLKTGAESSVDHLMKQISSFVSEISDEFKVVVVEAIRSLCMRYPKKSSVLLSFLSTMLRDEGCFMYKEALVDTIIAIIEENEETKERFVLGLAYLCEFIEDCEHISLATRILYLLGCEGPRCRNPRKYIRFIFNRVLLEAAPVRAAAVTALAKFGTSCKDLRSDIITLLQRCLVDSDDEVRDRASCYRALLCTMDEDLMHKQIVNGLNVCIDALVQSLEEYLLEPKSAAFDLKSVPRRPHVTADSKEKAGLLNEPAAPKVETTKSPDMVYAEQLNEMEEFASLGKIFKSSSPVLLTDADMEIRVSCLQHMFSNYVVFQFDCQNTLSDQILDNVHVSMKPLGPGWKPPVAEIACDRILSNASDHSLFLLVASSFSCVLNYTLKEGENDSSEGYEDKFELENVEVGLCNQMLPMQKLDFASFWDSLSTMVDLEGTYALSNVSTIQEAVDQLIEYLGLAVCERSGKVTQGKASHVLLLAGVYRNGSEVAVRAKLAQGADGCVNLHLGVRSPDGPTAAVVQSAIG
ncbi:coatomer subunit gamma [Trichuris trichiura]|uniref:Coatomer subunit gamma n=1 Tax=Trichuris trichiura TaxID=36087 RepID=A0A077Z5F5_TRITR|nr:coatomer subunit gamma [Trichuris trichiura]